MDMNIDEFVKLFAAQFEETAPEMFQADVKFRDLGEWDSLVALSIIAMTDEHFHVKLTGEDIRNSTTIRDVFEKVKAKTVGG